MRTIAHNIFIRLKKFFQLLSFVVVGLLLVFPHLWVGSLFQWQQYQLKSTLTQRLSAENGHSRRMIFSFNKSDFDTGNIQDFFRRNDTEFTYKNIFYDILETELSGNNILIKAYADYEETVSHTRQKQILANLWQNQHHKDKTVGFLGILKTFFLQPPSKTSLLKLNSKVFSYHFVYQTSLFRSLFQDNAEPPPQSAG